MGALFTNIDALRTPCWVPWVRIHSLTTLLWHLYPFTLSQQLKKAFPKSSLRVATLRHSRWTVSLSNSDQKRDRKKGAGQLLHIRGGPLALYNTRLPAEMT